MKVSAIKKTLEKVKELPTLPVVAQRISALLDDPRSNARDLAAVIEMDQSVTAKVLKLVNSAYFSLSPKVTNVSQAIALLGYKNISQMVVTLSVFDSLRVANGVSFDRREFWVHSIATAVLSERIALECLASFNEDAFTAGLLHDLGKVFMDGYLHDEFEEALCVSETRGISFYEAEHSLFDVDHAMIGEWIARYWKLPLFIVAAIKHHHQETEERSGLALSSDVVVDYVRVADTAVRSAAIGLNGDGSRYRPALHKKLFVRLPLVEKDIKTCVRDIREKVKNASALLNLAVGG
jgi:putative nucleotidyltransferase with HDIG domain